MKNTTRHKIGLNPARVSGGALACELTQRSPGQSPESFSTFYVSRVYKIQHLINIPAPNLLKMTSKKRDVKESM